MARRRRLPAEPVPARIEHLDAAGRGVAAGAARPLHVHGALPDELVEVRVLRRVRGSDEGVVARVLEPAPARVAPRCPHFGTCGGCRLQHLDYPAQVAEKQARLLRTLREAGGVEPAVIARPVTAAPWAYRRKARLGVRFVPARGGALVGFREKCGSRVAELRGCEVLAPRVGGCIGALRALVTALEAAPRIPQIEVAVGDAAAALVFRHLEPLGAADREALRGFAQARGLQLYVQPGAPQDASPLWPETPPPLAYRLPEEGLELRFRPWDFVQVNAEVNRALVGRALEWLAPAPGERVLDLFCGLGNFTLPLARRAARVTGVELDPGLLARARDNAHRNGIANVEFRSADLGAASAAAPAWAPAGVEKLFLDPPRSGAHAALARLPEPRPARIVYVSCNPATLADDLGMLVRERGYRLSAAGLVDMFPHTSHIEAIALLEGA